MYIPNKWYTMLQEKHHPKYVAEAVRLLTSISGGVSDRLRQQLLWCRTVNTKGGVGRNIEADLEMEHLNKRYKGK